MGRFLWCGHFPSIDPFQHLLERRWLVFRKFDGLRLTLHCVRLEAPVEERAFGADDGIMNVVLLLFMADDDFDKIRFERAVKTILLVVIAVGR